MTKNINRQKEIIAELKKTITEQKKEIKRLEKKIEDSTLELAKSMGIKPNESEKLNKKIEEALMSKKSPWEVKLTLFNLVKNLRVEESSLEEERENYLLESHLLNHLAKESMKKYKRATTQSFSEEK